MNYKSNPSMWVGKENLYGKLNILISRKRGLIHRTLGMLYNLLNWNPLKPVFITIWEINNI